MDIMNGQRLGLTTYYRTISVDNKPTTVIIGPSKFVYIFRTSVGLDHYDSGSQPFLPGGTIKFLKFLYQFHYLQTQNRLL